MSGTPPPVSPVDEPPGKDGVQAPNPPDLKPIPDWGPGENPVGTNPPVPTPDTGTTLPPGTTPGVIVGGGDPAPELPGNVDVPLVLQDGSTLSCTMGNWTGEPTSYRYQWKLDGVDVGVDDPSYTVNAGDVGATATCVVTATNAAGSVSAPPSNGVTVTAVTGTSTKRK